MPPDRERRQLTASISCSAEHASTPKSPLPFRLSGLIGQPAGPTEQSANDLQVRRGRGCPASHKLEGAAIPQTV